MGAGARQLEQAAHTGLEGGLGSQVGLGLGQQGHLCSALNAPCFPSLHLRRAQGDDSLWAGSSLSADLSIQWVLVAQSCPTPCNPMDCSLPGSSVHGILQTRILEYSLLRGIFPNQETEPRSPTLQADRLWSEAPGKPFIVWEEAIACAH